MHYQSMADLIAEQIAYEREKHFRQLQKAALGQFESILERYQRDLKHQTQSVLNQALRDVAVFTVSARESPMDRARARLDREEEEQQALLMQRERLSQQNADSGRLGGLRRGASNAERNAYIRDLHAKLKGHTSWATIIRQRLESQGTQLSAHQIRNIVKKTDI